MSGTSGLCTRRLATVFRTGVTLHSGAGSPVVPDAAALSRGWHNGQQSPLCCVQTFTSQKLTAWLPLNLLALAVAKKLVTVPLTSRAVRERCCAMNAVPDVRPSGPP